jgi:hypothetical protein
MTLTRVPFMYTAFHCSADSRIATHPIIQKTGNKSDTVMGTLFEVTPKELTSADFYEVDDYRRVSVVLASGLTAWVYVDARNVESDRNVSLQ